LAQKKLCLTIINFKKWPRDLFSFWNIGQSIETLIHEIKKKTCMTSALVKKIEEKQKQKKTISLP